MSPLSPADMQHYLIECRKDANDRRQRSSSAVYKRCTIFHARLGASNLLTKVIQCGLISAVAKARSWFKNNADECGRNGLRGVYSVCLSSFLL